MLLASETVKKEDSKLGNLKAILYLLQTNLESMQDEVDRSYELIKIGEKTDLSKKIEESLNNPIEHILASSSKFNEQVRNLLDKMVTAFFFYHKDIILSVHRGLNTDNELHYSIVLKEDNIENRSVIFEFFDTFNEIEMTSNYSVYFQFIPQKLVNKLTNSNRIIR
jgi:hypothetical protein